MLVEKGVNPDSFFKETMFAGDHKKVIAAVLDGKRVLFVAEKMAALNVVYSNFERIGLHQLCLELHSHKARKKVVLEDLERTYQLGQLQILQSTLARRTTFGLHALHARCQRMHQCRPRHRPGEQSLCLGQYLRL